MTNQVMLADYKQEVWARVKVLQRDLEETPVSYFIEEELLPAPTTDECKNLANLGVPLLYHSFLPFLTTTGPNSPEISSK